MEKPIVEKAVMSPPDTSQYEQFGFIVTKCFLNCIKFFLENFLLILLLNMIEPYMVRTRDNKNVMITAREISRAIATL